MASFFRIINSFIPFTDPSNPLWRDIVHTALLCTFLYFAPNLPWHRVADLVFRRRKSHRVAGGQLDAPPAANNANREAEETEFRRLEQVVEDELAEEGSEILDAPVDEPVVQGAEATAGPVDPHPQQRQPQRRRDPNKPVGAKKAKSLARRDQIRAYHEFQRAQGDAQRARDAEGAAEREEALRKERERRSKIEARIERERAEERRRRKEEEEARVKADAQTRNEVGRSLRARLDSDGMVRLEDLAKVVKRDVAFVEDAARKEGLLGVKEEDGKKTLTMITSHGWVVRVDEQTMGEVYAQAARWDGTEADGKVTWEGLGLILTDILRCR